MQANEPQSAPIRNFRVDWMDAYYPDFDGAVMREDMVIEVEGDIYVTEGQTVSRKYDIMVLMPDHASRKFCVIRTKERRNNQ